MSALERLRSTAAKADASFATLHSLARTLRDEGHGQQDLAKLFETLIVEAEDGTWQGMRLVDVLMDVLDCVVGVSAKTSMRLFGSGPRKCRTCDDERISGDTEPHCSPTPPKACRPQAAGLCALVLEGGVSEWCWCDEPLRSHSRFAPAVAVPAGDRGDDDDGSDDDDDDSEGVVADYEFGHCEYAWPDSDEPPLQLWLLSHRQRFAAKVWPAAELLSRHLRSHPQLVRGKAVLELGAGAALPSLCAAQLGARSVLVTDFADEKMLENMRRNLNANLSPQQLRRARVCGYNWSRPPELLLSELHALQHDADGAAADDGSHAAFAVGTAAAGGAARATATTAAAPTTKASPRRASTSFDVVLMSDLLYECEHEALLEAAAACLGVQPDARVLLTFQPHDPVQLGRQLRFFEIAPDHGFVPTLLSAENAPKMFDGDDDEEVDEEADEEDEGSGGGSDRQEAAGATGGADSACGGSSPVAPHVGERSSVLCRRVYLYELVRIRP